MRLNKLGSTDIYVSEIGFGVLPMGRSQLNLPLRRGAAIIEHALNRGINFFDTAQYYRTYPYIREAFKNSDANPIVVSKCLSPSYGDMKNAIREAMEQLDRDYIDIFLLHEVRGMKDFSNRSGAYRCLIEGKKAGIIRALGVSTHHVDTALGVSQEEECDVLFPLINKDGLGIRNGDGPGRKKDMVSAIKKNHEAGKGVFGMKIFGGGNLTGSYMDAIKYVYGLEGIASMVIGFGHEEEVDHAIDFVEGRLDNDFQPDVSKKRINIDLGDCEGCGACIKRCPNMAISFNTNGLAHVNHNICITCGYCAPVCPTRAIIMF